MKKSLLTGILGLVVMLTTSMSATPAVAATVKTQGNMSGTSIDKLSARFHVDPTELSAAIKKEANGPVFSPFSAVKANYGVKASTSFSPASSSSLTSVKEPATTKPAGIPGVYYEYNQNSTAYLATGNPTKSGVMPAIGMCAVHQHSDGTPYIPFGTDVVYQGNPVEIQGSSYSIFTVEDTGDLNLIQSPYWTDLFFGANTPANETAAIDYGNRLVNYDYTLN